MREPFRYTLTVRYVECDLQGHVYNSHYLTYFDMAFGAMLATAAGRPYSALVADGIDVVVAEAGIRYLAPAGFEDELTIEVTVKPPSNTSMSSQLTVKRDGAVIATGNLRHVCFDLIEYGKRPWPDEIRAGIEPFIALDDD